MLRSHHLVSLALLWVKPIFADQNLSAEIFRLAFGKIMPAKTPRSDFRRNNFPKPTNAGDGEARIRSREDMRAALLKCLTTAKLGFIEEKSPDPVSSLIGEA